MSFALPDLPATFPLSDAPATELSEAPLASDLPDGPMLRLGRVADAEQAYGFADAAYAYDDALGDAPPDYAIDYEGVEPWAWQAYDGSLRVSEPIADGDRIYYYRAGATDPYLIRDDDYAYAYSGGMLTAIFAPDGALLPYEVYGDRLLYASRYFARGRLIYARLRQGRRRPVIAANWVRREPRFAATIVRWGAGAARQPKWVSYARANRSREDRYWGEERRRRDVDARRFADWRGHDFRDAAPARAIPAAWKAARWAQDDRRFRAADGREDRDSRGARNRTERRAEARQDFDERQGGRRDRQEEGGRERTDRSGVLAGGGDRAHQGRDRMAGGRDDRFGHDRLHDRRGEEGRGEGRPDRAGRERDFAQQGRANGADRQRIRDRPDEGRGQFHRPQETAARERFGDQHPGRTGGDRFGREDAGRDARAQQRQYFDSVRSGGDPRGDYRRGGRSQQGGYGDGSQVATERQDRRRGGWGQQQPGFGGDRQSEGRTRDGGQRRDRSEWAQPSGGGREQFDRRQQMQRQPQFDRGQEMQRQQQFQAQQQMQRQQQFQAQQQMQRQQQFQAQQQMQRQQMQQQQQMNRQAQRAAQPSRSDAGEQRQPREHRRRPD